MTMPVGDQPDPEGMTWTDAAGWVPNDDYRMPRGTVRRYEIAAWRPIETAPKDCFIFLYCPEDNSRWLAKWQDRRWYGVDDCGLSRQGSSEGDPEVVTGWFVSHWMPLPTPPAS